MLTIVLAVYLTGCAIRLADAVHDVFDLRTPPEQRPETLPDWLALLSVPLAWPVTLVATSLSSEN